MNAMQVNGKELDGLPDVVGLRLVGDLRPLAAAWRRRNRRVPWAYFVRDALVGHWGRELPGKRAKAAADRLKAVAA